ncbi:MAG TPA: DegT/DnrJ/EryC1/StrS aminotransferase family protein [Spirochaetes bacterium]|nr:DegT/DnrJ/EryC1/StrS aminotransferase family protein [Spirochaetota bacterium]
MAIVNSRPTITRKELEGVLDCLISDRLEAGETVKNFESRLSELLSIKYCLALTSLTAAYHCAFAALEIQPGDEVIIPSYFDPSPLNALMLAGGTPVLVDMEENTLAPDLEQIRGKITEKTRAIVIKHFMGFILPLETIVETGVPIIEDISHAVGTESDDRPIGQCGIITVASFAPSMIITTGNGGMAATSNSRLFSRMRDLRGTGSSDSGPCCEYGMTDFQGAMGISQLSRLRDFLNRRRDIARIYYGALQLTPHRTIYGFNEAFAYQSFPVLFDAPQEKIEKYWKKIGVELHRPVKEPLHRLLNLRPMDFPHSDRMAKKLYSLPLYPTLTKKEIDKIALSLGRFI